MNPFRRFLAVARDAFALLWSAPQSPRTPPYPHWIITTVRTVDGETVASATSPITTRAEVDASLKAMRATIARVPILRETGARISGVVYVPGPVPAGVRA